MTDRPTAGLADTSIFIAQESGRALEEQRLPDQLAVSVITAAELEAGVLAAKGVESRWLRLNTLQQLASLELLEIDVNTAHVWAKLRFQLAQAKKRVNVNDLWIAAIAVQHGLPVVTQDSDFDVVAQVAGLELIKV